LSLHVNLIYRKKSSGFFSIEKVFGLVSNTIQHSTNNSIEPQRIELPFTSKGIVPICLNLLYLLQFKKGLFHITGDVHYAVLALPKKSTVLTIHDLVFLEASRGIRKYFLKWIYLKLPVSRAKYITTISERSKKEIVLHGKCNQDKIIVIPNPVDSNIRFEIKQFNQTEPRFLFIGLKENKNFDRTIQAISGIKIHLRIIGNLNAAQKALLQMHKINYSSDSSISDEQLIQEYIDCDAILFPSIYEGFGLPVIEGFKAGRPVITSDLEPMNEISQGAALLVDPFSVASIREAVIKLVNNEQLRDELVERGFDVVKQYEVETISQQYINLWSKIADQNDR
jgi:glycosyltransferase involved in cell wall biosynthesis